MNYNETVAFLYSQLPMFTRIGAAAFKKDLHNTIHILAKLGNPHHRIKTIHIAGTNGKGSCSHMLAAIFHANGYKTGLYTSPHLKDFRERIKMSARVESSFEYPGPMEMIPQKFIVDFVAKTRKLISEIEPSFFELTVAMAFQFFAEEQVDIAIIETGMGGRLDSTNVIDPELSIITNIGWDHMNLLGNSLVEIAFEKAGIIKPYKPVVIGETLEETKPVFTKIAETKRAPLYFAERSIIKKVSLSPEAINISLENEGIEEVHTTDLGGIYQQFNLRTILTALNVLKEQQWLLDDKNVNYALNHVKKLTGLHGRWEVLHKEPYLILDVAHNEDGIRQLLKQVALLNASIQNIHIVVGVVKDKEVDKIMQIFPQEFKYYFTNASIPRALGAAELKDKANAAGLEGDAFENVNGAINEALRKASKNDLILVCGSVFVVGEVDLGTLIYRQEAG